ncbi:MAG: DUF2092 domain-containing protein [Syntrophobacteraceae bacterium]
MMKKFRRRGLSTRGRFPAAILLIALLGIMLPSMRGWSAEEAKPAATPAATPATPATPQPEKILQQACDFLKSAQQYSFKAEVTDDRVYTGGKKLQYAFDLEAYVQRPDKVRINAAGDLENKQFFYNGKTITLYDKFENAYAVLDTPGTIDEAMEKAGREYGLRISLVDLAESDTCALMTKGVKHALYVGEGIVRGIKCHHLAFDKDDIQWQIWIDAGEKPLIRKLLINQKKLPAAPQWTAYFTDWNFSPQLADDLFTFTSPQGAAKTRFVSLKEQEAQRAKAVRAAKKKTGAKKGKK